jgi:2-alkyl-3-oxoalkanoate reductase
VMNTNEMEPHRLKHLWLAAFTRAAGAPAPPRVTQEEALRTLGPDAVCLTTRLTDASN